MKWLLVDVADDLEGLANQVSFLQILIDLKRPLLRQGLMGRQAANDRKIRKQ
jgi:hypothetical protein